MFALRLSADPPISPPIKVFLITKSPMIPSASLPPGRRSTLFFEISKTSTFANTEAKRAKKAGKIRVFIGCE